jgi:hypothetical protein
VQDRETLLWMRRPFLTYSGKMPEGVTVVHGHTPGENPNILHNRIGLETGACYGGALSCGVLTNILDRVIRVTAEEIQVGKSIGKGASGSEPSAIALRRVYKRKRPRRLGCGMQSGPTSDS